MRRNLSIYARDVTPFLKPYARAIDAQVDTQDITSPGVAVKNICVPGRDELLAQKHTS